MKFTFLFSLLAIFGITVAEYYGRQPPPKPKPAPPKPPTLKKCPAGWLTFFRPQGTWCVAVFHELINQPTAETRCAQRGAKLTGLQNANERIQVASEGRRILQKYNFGDASIWLGARRKADCPRKGYCPWYSTFRWTDGHTTGNAGFGFAHGQPDGTSSYTYGVQDCVHMFVYPNGPTSARWPGIKHGDLDDQYCLEGRINPNRKMYACGKRP